MYFFFFRSMIHFRSLCTTLYIVRSILQKARSTRFDQSIITRVVLKYDLTLAQFHHPHQEEGLQRSNDFVFTSAVPKLMPPFSSASSSGSTCTSSWRR